MSLFSQRKGIRPLKKAIQREQIDEELKNRIWSAMQMTVWSNYHGEPLYANTDAATKAVLVLVRELWLHFFKAPVDTIPSFHDGHPKSAYEIIREAFFKADWWLAYDFLEFVVKRAPEPWSLELARSANSYLEEENSAYRVVGTEIVEVTSDVEIAAIETALEKTTRAVQSHLQNALRLLSDRRSPDFGNSIKESISAVEALCKAVSGEPKATLGDALKRIKAKATVHPALESAFLKLYGYTSDAGGIRHAMLDPSERPSFADAKFMLVTCSSFCNYLLTKAAENGIKVK